MRCLSRRSGALASAVVIIFLISCGDSTTGPLDVNQHYTVDVISNGTVIGAGFNDQGQLAGFFFDGVHPTRAVVSKDSTINLELCAPVGINDYGAVACDIFGVWQVGTITPYTYRNDISVVVSGLNDAGTVAGLVLFSSHVDPTAYCAGMYCIVIATTTGSRIIQIPAGAIGARVPRMSNSADVLAEWTSGAGVSHLVKITDSTVTPYACAGLPSDAALVAVGGDDELIGTMPSLDGATVSDAFVCKDGVVHSLGSITKSANDISRSGLIVGSTDDGRGFLWDNGTLRILDGESQGGDWRISSVNWVNDAGQMVVTATDHSGKTGILLLTPK